MVCDATKVPNVFYDMAMFDNPYVSGRFVVGTFVTCVLFMGIFWPQRVMSIFVLSVLIWQKFLPCFTTAALYISPVSTIPHSTMNFDDSVTQ